MAFRRFLRSRWYLVAGAVLLGALGGLAAAAFIKPAGDISNPEVSFTQADRPATRVPPKAAKKPRAPYWPFYGNDAARTRTLEAEVAGPYRRGWNVYRQEIFEFGPVIAGDTLFVVDNGANLNALDRETGKARWITDIGDLAAASPAVQRGDPRVYAVVLCKEGLGKCTSGQGSVAAVNQKTGKIVWKRDLPSRAESSPLVRGDRLFFGTEDGTVYALNARTGKTIWTFDDPADAVKGGLALDKGTLFFGSYDGSVYAIRAEDGSKVWSAGSGGGTFGGSGNFYATPSVAFGRVFVGNTDSRIYSYGVRDGKLAWATGTGGLVYGSAAVADVPGLGPTVYVGSYDGVFYALDARTGAVRWTYNAGGKISGGSSVIGDVVYFSNLGDQNTVGLDTRTGKVAFEFAAGAFNPAISDGEQLFITGYASIHQLIPRSRKGKEAATEKAAQRRDRSRRDRRARAAEAKRKRTNERAGRDRGRLKRQRANR